MHFNELRIETLNKISYNCFIKDMIDDIVLKQTNTELSPESQDHNM